MIRRDLGTGREAPAPPPCAVSGEAPAHLTPEAGSWGPREVSVLQQLPKPQAPSRAMGDAVPSLPPAAARGDVLQSSLPFSSFP